MKKLTTLIVILLCATTLFAQAPEKFTYQAVVRNANNSLVTNTLVGVRVSIIQGSVTGNGVYVETQMPSTNANGLITLKIGDGNVVFGSFEGIDWSDGPFFMRTEIDPDGGNSYSVTTTQQLLSVPYALYAKEAGNGFSGDYNDLTNTPAIPTVPTNVSAFTNDAGYITMDSVPAIPTNVSAFTNDAGYLTGYAETDPQFNAWNKDYNDLINKPTIPTVPTNVSAFTNDAGYITMDSVPAIPTSVSAFTNDAGYITGYAETDPQFNAWDKDYDDLINKPVIPTVPTTVSAFTNDAGYITMDSVPAIPTSVSAFTNDAGYLTGYTETDPQFNAWDKDYNDLTNKPVIPTVPTNVSAFTNDAGYLTSFTEQQVLTISNDTIFLSGGSFVKLPAAAAGFSGDYNDLTNKPTIPAVPTNVSAFTNDAGYITGYAETDPQFNAWDKDYNDLINKPTIPAVPTAVSAFTNDAGYLTSYTETDPLFNAWDKNYNDLTNKPVLFDGDYNSLTNKPTIPTVPTAVSSFTNDVGYLTSYTETDPLFNAWDKNYNDLNNKPVLFDGDYNSLTNKPTIPTVPTNVSAFTNDAGYLTAANVQEAANIPTNVSAFTNDAGYLTSYTETDPLFNAWDKNYNDLTNKPTIPTVPTNVSAFTNDAGYITSNDVPAETDPQFNAWDKDYNDLINKPTIPTVPANVSAFTNDAGYITSSDVPAETDPQFSAWDKDYNDLINKPAIPTVPANVSAFTNDVGYITSSDVPAETDPQFSAWNKDYNDLTNKPTIPTVNDATLSIRQNGTEVGVFTANQGTNKTVDIITLTTADVQALINSSTAALQQQVAELQQQLQNVNFVCGVSTVKDYDNNEYNTVKIGSQCWLKENLRSKHYADGTSIDSGIVGTSSTTTGYYYNYATSFMPLEPRGYFYNWKAVMRNSSSSSMNPSGVQGVCPAGWHVPSDAECTQLTDFVSSQSEYVCGDNSINIAKALSSTSGWTSDNNISCNPSNNEPTTNNATGFSATPGGQFTTGGYGNNSFYAYFCSATEDSSDKVWCRRLAYNSAVVGRYSFWKQWGFPVRCLRD